MTRRTSVPTSNRRPRPLARLHRWHRSVLVHRRPLAALAAGAAVLAGLQAASPAPPATTAVLTAAHDLPGGSVLGEADLQVASLPPDLVPDHAVTEPGELRGRTLAAPLTRGEVITSVRTVAPDLLAGYPGRSAVPVRVADAAVVDLLRVGDTVTLLAADPEGRAPATTLATDVRVIAIPRARAEAFGSPTPGRLVVVAVSPAEASEVASRSMSGLLTILWNHR